MIMGYRKIANLWDSASNKPSKLRTRNWVEINDDIRGAYLPNKQISFKTIMLRSSLCDYSDAYILVKGNISVNNPRQYDTICWELNPISGFFAFFWLIVWADGIDKCGWCLAGGRGFWLKGLHQIPSVSWIFHHSLHFHIY